MGDCDSDSDCKGDLRCGINNCQKEFGHIKKNWRWYDDCCTCEFSTITSKSVKPRSLVKTVLNSYDRS